MGGRWSLLGHGYVAEKKILRPTGTPKVTAMGFTGKTHTTALGMMDAEVAGLGCGDTVGSQLLQQFSIRPGSHCWK